MKERLVEDWLTRINERGYELPFCQTLVSRGFQILRCGHSPIEHGKDVIALSPDGAVCAYQLKTGDFGQAEINRYHEQINMLVECRPTYPNLPANFEYRPYFVTTGEFKDPAVSLINERNAGWSHRNLPSLILIGGRQLLAEFVALSSDFWPVDAPDVRRFRELYLVDGRGDFDIAQFARFLFELLDEVKSSLDLERRVAAANLFSSYLLSEFYKQADHWSVLRGWTICAAQVAWAGISGKHSEKHWIDSCKIAQNSALIALEDLAKEVLADNAFLVKDRELDDYTKMRNTLALSAASCWQLISNRDNLQSADFRSTLGLLVSYLERGRLTFWGEGALSQFVNLIWMLELGGEKALASSVLIELIGSVAERNSRFSENPYEDPYFSPDECLAKTFERNPSINSPRRQAVESYSLYPMILFAVRRNLREELDKVWKKITEVALTWFRPDAPEDTLLWFCSKGKESADSFARPQSWKELCDFAFREDRERIPKVLLDNINFAMLYCLVFQHRMPQSLLKYLDEKLCKSQ